MTVSKKIVDKNFLKSACFAFSDYKLDDDYIQRFLGKLSPKEENQLIQVTGLVSGMLNEMFWSLHHNFLYHQSFASIYFLPSL